MKIKPGTFVKCKKINFGNTVKTCSPSKKRSVIVDDKFLLCEVIEHIPYSYPWGFYYNYESTLKVWVPLKKFYATLTRRDVFVLKQKPFYGIASTRT